MSETEEKKKRGAPPLFDNIEDLQSKIDEFFAQCGTEPWLDDNGKIITNSKGTPLFKIKPPTLTGLALHLGFESRQSIYDYEKRNDDFSYAIKRARLACENFAERGILSGEVFAAAGIFVLKNYGWSDKQEVELSGSSVINVTVEGIEPEPNKQ